MVCDGPIESDQTGLILSPFQVQRRERLLHFDAGQIVFSYKRTEHRACGKPMHELVPHINLKIHFKRGMFY